MAKLEKLCEKLTGIDPSKLEPKPPPRQLEKWIRAARSEQASAHPEVLLPTEAPIYTLVETNREQGVDGHLNVPYSVISRTHPDGVMEHAFVWGQSLHPDHVSIAALQVPRSDWFKLSENLRL